MTRVRGSGKLRRPRHRVQAVANHAPHWEPEAFLSGKVEARTKRRGLAWLPVFFGFGFSSGFRSGASYGFGVLALCLATWGTGCSPSEPASDVARPSEQAARPSESALDATSPLANLMPGDYSGYNLIVISVDTLRADHLGLYGYERNTSPAFDRIGDESIVFNRAHVPRGLTWPSLVALFTSLYPITSNVRDNGDLLPGADTEPVSRN